jgi:hypothetical protein
MSERNIHMEKQFFNWASWDQTDTIAFGFYDCTLKVDIGEHKVGEVIPYVEMDYSKGVMTFLWFEEVEHNGCCPVSKEELYTLSLVVS